MRPNGLRVASRQLEGDIASSELSISKLLRGDLLLSAWGFPVGQLGPGAEGRDPEWQRGLLNLHGTGIGVGSRNMQRNIIAERIDGLPRDDYWLFRWRASS